MYYIYTIIFCFSFFSPFTAIILPDSGFIILGVVIFEKTIYNRRMPKILTCLMLTRTM